MPHCRHCQAPFGWAVDYCPFCGQPQRAGGPGEAEAPPAGQSAVEPPPAAGGETMAAWPAPASRDIPPRRLPQTPPRPGRPRKLPLALAMLAGLAAALAWTPFSVFIKFLAPQAIEPRMVSIKPGCFDMGSPKNEAGRDEVDERPHKVCVEKGFYLGQYETTFEEYAVFVRDTGISPPQEAGKGRYPVIGVSWEEAKAYAAWLSKQTGRHYRLPTEAEWEYAARAGTKTPSFWGDNTDLKRACGHANYADCPGAPGRTTPVGGFKPNPWGLYDMLGNVFEMTGSAYDKNYGGGETRPAAPDDPPRYAVRGGSWHPNIDTLRSAWRGRTDKTSKRLKWQMGFRLARD